MVKYVAFTTYIIVCNSFNNLCYITNYDSVLLSDHVNINCVAHYTPLLKTNAIPERFSSSMKRSRPSSSTTTLPLPQMSVFLCVQYIVTRIYCVINFVVPKTIV